MLKTKQKIPGGSNSVNELTAAGGGHSITFQNIRRTDGLCARSNILPRRKGRKFVLAGKEIQ